METGLQGRRVLVTGASGGIGSACARLSQTMALRKVATAEGTWPRRSSRSRPTSCQVMSRVRS